MAFARSFSLDGIEFPLWFDASMRRMAPRSWSTRQRMTYFSRLAAQIENGLSAPVATRRLWERSKKRWRGWKYDPEVLALDSIATRLENGSTLDKALKGWARASEITVIAAGERSGDIPESLRMVVSSAQRITRLRQRLFNEMWEPTMIGLLGLYLFYLVGAKMVPSMETVLPPVKWPMMARMLLPIGWLATSGAGLITVGGLIVLGVIIFLTLPKWSGGWRRHFDHIPPWSIYRVLTGGTWIIGFCNLINAGVREQEALKIQAAAAPRWLRDRLVAARIHVANGKALGEAFRLPGYGFPDNDIIDDMETFAGFANFPTLLRKIGEEWVEDNEERIVKNLRILSTMINVGINLLILIVVFGMNDLQQMITTVAHM